MYVELSNTHTKVTSKLRYLLINQVNVARLLVKFELPTAHTTSLIDWWE